MWRGRWSSGNVYLNVKGYSSYHNLYIRLEGFEFCLWHEGAGKDRRRYENDRKTYQYEFVLRNFQGQIVPGHYTFPFTFPLPNGLSGSMWYNDRNYIKYDLSAYLVCYDKKNDNQVANI